MIARSGLATGTTTETWPSWTDYDSTAYSSNDDSASGRAGEVVHIYATVRDPGLKEMIKRVKGFRIVRANHRHGPPPKRIRAMPTKYHPPVFFNRRQHFMKRKKQK